MRHPGRDQYEHSSPERYSGKPLFCVRCTCVAYLNQCRMGLMADVTLEAYDALPISADCVLESDEAAMARRATWLLDLEFNPEHRRQR